LALAQNLKEFEKKGDRVHAGQRLALRLIERHEAPVVSFNTYVKAGSLNDPNGQTGLAHMFEHMAFKGTPWIGSKKLGGGEEGARRVEQIYARLEEERRKDLRRQREKIGSLENQLKAAIDKVVPAFIPTPPFSSTMADRRWARRRVGPYRWRPSN